MLDSRIRSALDWTILRSATKSMFNETSNFRKLFNIIHLKNHKTSKQRPNKCIFHFQCILGSIIVVALKGLLMQMKDFVDFWRISRAHAIVWMSTFLTVVIVSIDIGLLVGIVVSLAVIFIRGLKPYTCLLGHVPKTDLYLNIKRYKAVSLFEKISEYSLFSSNLLFLLIQKWIYSWILCKNLLEELFENLTLTSFLLCRPKRSNR